MTDGLTQLDRQIAAQAAQLERDAEKVLERSVELTRNYKQLFTHLIRGWEARN